MKTLFQWWGQSATLEADSTEPMITHPVLPDGTEDLLHYDSEDQATEKEREEINLSSPWTHGLL